MTVKRSFSTMYGHTLHPESKAGTCYWCGEDATMWDYTPHRVLVADKIFMASVKLDKWAVQACKKCVSAMTYKRDFLLTLEDKARWTNSRRYVGSSGFDLLRQTPRKKLKSWQLGLGDGTVIDKPDYDCNAYELQAKRAWYDGQVVEGTSYHDIEGTSLNDTSENSTVSSTNEPL